MNVEPADIMSTLKRIAENTLTYGAFRRGLLTRRRRYHGLQLPPSPPVVRELSANGVAILPGVVTTDLLEALAVELDRCCATGTHLNRPSNDTVRPSDDLAAPTVFLTDEDLARGEDHFRHLTNFVAVAQPFVHCPISARLAFSDLLIAIAAGYLSCPPAIGGINLRRSYVNDLPAFDTLNFHSDPNSTRFLKFFFYLDDVDLEGGPFAYVLGSHRRKFIGWRRKYRWTPEEIEGIYGADAIFYATARKGDLVVADTTGFHRGTKVRRHDRSMLTVNYAVHPEFRGRQTGFHIDVDTLAALPPAQRMAADFLTPIALNPDLLT